jgi:phage-related minor tail protein
MAYEEIGIRMRADGVVETSNGVTLTGKAVEDLGKKLDTAAGKSTQFGAGAQAAGAGARVLANELTNAMQLPGSVGNALEGMAARGGTAMAGLGSGALLLGGAFAVAGVAAVVLTRAYLQGQAEAQSYTRAIVLSGNAAGMTAGSMADLARSVGDVVGTQGAAADMVAKLVTSAQVGRAGLQQFTEVGVRMQRELGMSADDVTQKFAELGREPVKASIKLNEQHNYLTLSVYQQIKALKEQGRWTEAAALAQQTYADAMNPRLKTLEANLGTLEKAWRGVMDGAKGAWDAMLNVGREQTKQQQIDALQRQIESYEEEIAGAYQRGDSDRAAVLEKELNKRREMQAVLQSDLRLAQRSADLQAANAAAVREGIKADQEKDKNRGGGTRADPYAQLNEQIARRLGMAQAELDAGDKLSAADAFRVEMLREIAKAEKDIGTTKADQLRASVDSATAKLREVDAQRQSLQLQEQLERQFQADRQAATRAAEQQTEALRSSRAALIDEGAALTLSKTQLHERAQAQLDVQIADKQARLERISGLPAYAEEATELQRQIGLLREVKGLKSDNFRAVQKQEEDAAYKQRVDSMAQSIEDGLVNGFREGRSLSDIFFNELKAQAARTILKMPIQAMAETGTNWINMIVKGIGAFAGAGTGTDTTSTYGMAETWVNGTPPGRADGGRVDAGELYKVGERGPELLQMGSQGGTIIPNHALGGPQINFNPTINIDSRTDKAEVINLVSHAMRQSQAQLLEMMQRRQA